MKPFSGKNEDACPQWARDIIDQIRQIEMKLGNIPPEQPWSGDELEAIQARAAKAGSVHEDNHVVDSLFSKLCAGLIKDGRSPDAIAQFVNVRIGYEKGPRYCSADEVTEAAQR